MVTLVPIAVCLLTFEPGLLLYAVCPNCYCTAQVTLYDDQGGVVQQLDFINAPDARDYTCAAFNPTGDVAVLGGYNCLSTCSFNTKAGVWELSNTKKL